MNKDLELSILRADQKALVEALQKIRQDAHDSWGTTGAQHALKRIERLAAHTLDYRTHLQHEEQHGPR